MEVCEDTNLGGKSDGTVCRAFTGTMDRVIITLTD